jgi:hypothetical protein
MPLSPPLEHSNVNCHVGACNLMNSAVLGWFEDALIGQRRSHRRGVLSVRFGSTESPPAVGFSMLTSAAPKKRRPAVKMWPVVKGHERPFKARDSCEYSKVIEPHRRKVQSDTVTN